jgi:hypothetical protein
VDAVEHELVADGLEQERSPRSVELPVLKEAREPLRVIVHDHAVPLGESVVRCQVYRLDGRRACAFGSSQRRRRLQLFVLHRVAAVAGAAGEREGADVADRSSPGVGGAGALATGGAAGAQPPRGAAARARRGRRH